MEDNRMQSRIGPSPDATTVAFWSGVHAYLPSIPLATLLTAPWRALSYSPIPGNCAQVIHLGMTRVHADRRVCLAN
ncbi:MAG: hypothetical protein ACYC9L_03005 [Sulfuricaulis sp.]